MKWSNFKTLDEPLKVKFPDILLSDHEMVSNKVIERNSLKGFIFLISLLLDNEFEVVSYQDDN